MVKKTASNREAIEDPDFYIHLGLAVQDVRQERALSRRALAMRSGVSYPYLSEIENGHKRMSVRALQLISRGLSMKPYQLLERAEASLYGDSGKKSGEKHRAAVVSELIAVLGDIDTESLGALLVIAGRIRSI